MKITLTTLLLFIAITTLAQHKPPTGKHYPAVGELKPLDTVAIYNSWFVIKSYPFAMRNGGQVQYEAVSLGNYKRIKKGQVVCVWDGSVQVVRKYKQ